MSAIFYIDEAGNADSSLDARGAAERIRKLKTGKGPAAWIDVEAPDPAELRTLGEAAGLHELTLEDIGNPKVREKWEDYDGYSYLVGHGLNLNPGRDALDTINVSIVVLPRCTLSFHAQRIRSFDIVRERLHQEHRDRVPQADWLVYALLDALTDLYVEEVERFSEKVDRLDEDVLNSSDSARTLDSLRKARREASLLRRRLAPKREFLQSLTYQNHPALSRPVQVYLRDVLDHVIRMQELLDIARDTLVGAQSNYLAQVSNRMNAVMKTLSIVATIMLPLTLLTGVFGMNIPVPGQEAHGMAWFAGLVAAMLLIAVGLAFVFRRRGWF